MTTNIYDTAKSTGDYSTMIKCIEAAGLADTLRGQGPYTVFLPTDGAFRNLPIGTVEGWMNDIPKLRSVMNYHIANGNYISSEIHSMTTDGRTPNLLTLQGSSVTLKTNLTARSWMDSKQSVYVNDAKVIRPEIENSNGTIQVIDRVLLPVQPDSTTRTSTETSTTTRTVTTA